MVLAPTLPPERIGELVELCAEAGLPAFVPIDHGGHGEPDLPPPTVEAVGHTHFLVYHRRLGNASTLLLKSILDRVLAALLIVVLAPLIATVALLVRIFIGSPVLYIQRRGGLFGRPFSMLKFRTMRIGAEREKTDLLAHNEMDGPVFKMANDPRVTRLGRILRRTSLDELPQLFNVLVGHMSLVGPRPLVIPETQALHGGHRRRLAMRPGPDLPVAGQRTQRSDLHRVDDARPRVRRHLEPRARLRDPAAHRPGDPHRPRRALTLGRRRRSVFPPRHAQRQQAAQRQRGLGDQHRPGRAGRAQPARQPADSRRG